MGPVAAVAAAVTAVAGIVLYVLRTRHSPAAEMARRRAQFDAETERLHGVCDKAEQAFHLAVGAGDSRGSDLARLRWVRAVEARARHLSEGRRTGLLR